MERTAEEARSALIERLQELTGRKDALAVHLRGLDGRHEADSEDVVAFSQDDEVLEGLEDAALQEIRMINDALQRIEDGTYGICVACGNEIAPARLEALPHTPLCVVCAGNAAEVE
jgi:RNA polymerase-binding transcription factor DksA